MELEIRRKKGSKVVPASRFHRVAHLAGPGQPITRLANADVEAEFPDPQVPHGVLGLVLATLDHPDLSEIRQEFRRLPEELEETQMGQVTRY